MTDSKGRTLTPIDAFMEVEVGRWGNQVQVRRERIECYKIEENDDHQQHEKQSEGQKTTV